MNNMAAFNALAGWMLATLYDSHPMQITLALADAPSDVQDVIAGTGVQAERFFWDTAEWLIREGFITVKSRPLSPPKIGSASLTIHGLRALNAVPEAVAGKEPIGGRLSDAVKNTGREGRKALISELIGQAVAVAGKALMP